MSRKNRIKSENKRFGTSFRISLGISGLSGDLADDLGVNLNLSEKEYGYFELNTQATKPFVAAYFIKSFIDYDTKVKSGDLIVLEDGRKLLVTVKNPDIYRREIVRYMCICYKCNKTIKVDRKAGTERDPETRRKTYIYDEITPRVDCLLTEGDFRTELKEEDFGRVETTKRELYIQGSIGIETGDRITASDEAKPLYVREIKKSYFDGIDFCMVDYEG